jgi:hypothetical protein
MFNTNKYKFNVGQKVRVREDLSIGVEYPSEDGTTSNYFILEMAEYAGKLTEIIGRRNGQYVIKADAIRLYTDTMLQDVFEEEDAEFAEADYEFNEEVELVLAELMEHQRLQAIDRALDEKMHLTNPTQFQELVDLRYR